MATIALVLLFLAMLPAGVEAAPIELSASVGGLSVDGSTLDEAQAADCLPGQKCPVPVKRKIELALPKEPSTPPQEKITVIVIPALPPELKAPVEAILKKALSQDVSELLFELLKEELLKGDLDDFLPFIEKTHLKLGFKNGTPKELSDSDYAQLLEELLGGGFLYKGEAKFVPGFIPLGAALILFNPETNEGAAAVTLFAVPYPATWLLVVLGLVPLLRPRTAASVR